MTNLPNDDLIDEVLNQDPKYLEKKSIDEKSFRAKIKSKKASPLNSFQSMIQIGTMRFATSLFLFVLGITLGNLALNKTFSNNNQNLSNVTPVSDLVSNQKQQENSSLSGANKKSLSNNAQPKSDQSEAIINYKTQVTADSSASSIQDTDKAQGSATNSLPPLKYETLVQNPNTGDRITFKYDQNDKILYYDGIVSGSDGCSFLKDSKIEISADRVILNYSLAKKSGFCIQILTEIQINGNQKIDLYEVQLADFQNLFIIQKTQ
jgi:hypothetical protein